MKTGSAPTHGIQHCAARLPWLKHGAYFPLLILVLHHVPLRVQRSFVLTAPIFSFNYNIASDVQSFCRTLPAYGRTFVRRSGARTACSVHLTIHVSETHTGLPVSPASLYLDNGSRGYEADDAGSIRADSLCPGQYSWLIQADGHISDTGIIVLTVDTTIRIRLTHSAQSLEQVTVHDERIKTIISGKGKSDKSPDR